MLFCDGCDKFIEIIEDDTMPGGWHEVEIKGWGGSFHACSETCEVEIRRKLSLSSQKNGGTL